MRIEVIGDGTPKFAVVACIHGDEVCGQEAIEWFLNTSPEVNKPVELIIANEEALEKGQRFIDEDLNRAFPGNQEGQTHETRLAADLLNELEGKQVLDFHSTVSLSESEPPFGLLQTVNNRTKSLTRATGVERVVDISYVSGGFIKYVDGVAVECGKKGSSSAIENAIHILQTFLKNKNIIDGEAEESNPDVYQIHDRVAKNGHEFIAKNFERVTEGEKYARGQNGCLRADEPFYPVLMSTEGYEDILGYKAKRIGTIDDLNG